MSTVQYFTNGLLNDEAGTGVTLAQFLKNNDGSWQIVQKDGTGNPNFGYEAKEVTEDEYQVWASRIANPDMVNYFPGIFGNGIVNKAIYEKNKQAAYKKYVASLAVSRGSALLVLIQKGITKEMIYEKIAELSESEASIAKLWFDEALTFKRSNNFVIKLGGLLNMTDEQMDELFIAASQVK